MILDRRIAVASALLAALALAGCATTPTPVSVADTIAASPQHKTLSRLVTEADLADTLRGAGPVTLFAPTDEAFAALPAKTLADLAADRTALRSVLTYHVLPAKVTSDEVKTGNVKTVQGANLAVSKAGTFVTVEDAVVQRADVAATNGVIHVVDKVLMPPRR